MKEKTVYTFKNIAHILLLIISMSFTTMLFVQFSNNLIGKLLWGSFGVSLEIIKIYIFLNVKKDFKAHNFKQYLYGIIAFIVFLGLASTSAIATLSYALNSIENKQFTSKLSSIDRDIILQDIQLLEREIETKLKQQSGLPADYITASERFSSQISILVESRKERVSELKLLDQSTLLSDNSHISDSFSLLGDLIDLKGKDVLFYLMLLMVILLEVSLAITSGEIEEELVLKENSYELRAYIKSLFDVNGVRLKSDEAISKETGIPLNNCLKHRTLLLNTTYNNIPLIESGRGATKSNFTKEQVLKIITIKIGTTQKRREH